MSRDLAFEDHELVRAVWSVIAPDRFGGQGVGGGADERQILTKVWENAMLGDEAPHFNSADIRGIHERLVRLVKKGRLVDHPHGGWRTPTAPEDALYVLKIKGEQHTYSLRGSQEHAAKETCATLADLSGSRADFLEAVFIAPLAVGKRVKVGATGDSLSFIVERSL